MKRKLVHGLAGGSMLILSASANAAYTGLQTVLHTSVVDGGALRDVYRVYVSFSNPNDYVTAIAGSDGAGNMVIQTRNSNNTGPGTAFYNPGTVPAGNRSPWAPGDPLEWGTYATIGVSYQIQGTGPSTSVDQTAFTPGFPNFIAGSSLNSNNISWFLHGGPNPQGQANFLGDGDPFLRVQIMQLAVNAGELVRGTVALSGVNAGALAATYQFTGQTFAALPPAPGAIWLFGVAGLMGSRRRRGSGDENQRRQSS